MRTLLITALAVVAAPAAAQTGFDPVSAHRAQMEQIRTQTEQHGLSASVQTVQTTLARQQLLGSVSQPTVALTPQPEPAPASSPRCDPRTTTPQTPCVVKPTPPRRR